MLRFGPLAVLVLLCGCTPAPPAAIALPPQPNQKLNQQPKPQLKTAPKPDSKPVLKAELPPGQRGPTTALLAGGDLRLSTRRTEERFQDGNRRWKVELHRGTTLLASWDAASGIAERQTADRRWSPGNAAPLPAGDYSLGQPEPWGDDLWFDLQPRFDTSRSALGIHRCYPGTGCICLPSRVDIDALAAWVRQSDLRSLTVVN